MNYTYTNTNASVLKIFARVHFLFFNYGRCTFGTFAFATNAQTSRKIKRAKFCQRFLGTVVILCMLTMTSCNQTTTTINKNKIEQELKFNPVYDISAPTRMFLDELEKELRDKNQHLQFFTPSQKLIDKFSIKQTQNSYSINGFIKVANSFDKTALEKLGVMFGQPAGKIITVTVPLQHLPEFLNSSGIEYFEVSQKVFQK